MPKGIKTTIEQRAKTLQVKEPTSLQEVATRQNVDLRDLLAANPGVRTVAPGVVLNIPKKGIKRARQVSPEFEPRPFVEQPAPVAPAFPAVGEMAMLQERQRGRPPSQPGMVRTLQQPRPFAQLERGFAAFPGVPPTEPVRRERGFEAFPGVPRRQPQPEAAPLDTRFTTGGPLEAQPRPAPTEAPATPAPRQLIPGVNVRASLTGGRSPVFPTGFLMPTVQEIEGIQDETLRSRLLAMVQAGMQPGEEILLPPGFHAFLRHMAGDPISNLWVERLVNLGWIERPEGVAGVPSRGGGPSAPARRTYYNSRGRSVPVGTRTGAIRGGFNEFNRGWGLVNWRI